MHYTTVVTVKFVCIGTYVRELHKMVYLQNRRYLHKEDTELKHDVTSFSVKVQETRLAPLKRSYDVSVQTCKSYDTLMGKLVILSVTIHAYYSGLHYYRKQTAAAMAVSKLTGYKHSHCFMKLPNHN